MCNLNADYIDLLLIHEPTGDYLEIYRAMEDAYKAGKHQFSLDLFNNLNLEIINAAN